MDTFFSAQTYGLLFNDRLSAVLKVPLLSTSLRSHLNAKILEQKTHEHLHWVQRILDALGDEAPVRQVTTPSVIHGAAPFLLQMVLSDEDMRSPSEYWKVVLKYRRAAAGFREEMRVPDLERSDSASAALDPYRRARVQVDKRKRDLEELQRSLPGILGERARLTLWRTAWRNTFVVAE